MLFEIGREYEFTTGTGDTESRWSAEVLDIALPLIKVSGPGGEIILNTRSASFFTARLLRERTEEEKYDLNAGVKRFLGDADEA